MCFKYLSGETVELGDVVITNVFGKEEEAFVFLIIKPYSDEARDYYSCYETGGIMFKVGVEQSLILMPELDEDTEFLHRKE